MIRLSVFLAVIVSLVFAGLSRATPPPRKAYPAKRIVFWVCPLDVHGNPVTKPQGVCFRDFAP
jgi:hypothetical protein